MKDILVNWRLYVFIGALFLFVKMVNIIDLVVRARIYANFYVPEEDMQSLSLEQFFDKE